MRHAELKTLYFVFICSAENLFVEDSFALTRNKFRMVYKVDGNPQLESRDWSMYSNIFKFLKEVKPHSLDIEKAFDNIWHNGLQYKIFQQDLPAKMTHWPSDFLVGCVIQVNINGFLSNQINPNTGVPQGSVLSPLLFLIYVNEPLTPHYK